MTGDAGADARSGLHRVLLTARAPIGGALVGCTGARTDTGTGHPHAALAITDADGSHQLWEVVLGDEIALQAGTLLVEQIRPWDPPHTAGVALRWLPR